MTEHKLTSAARGSLRARDYEGTKIRCKDFREAFKRLQARKPGKYPQVSKSPKTRFI